MQSHSRSALTHTHLQRPDFDSDLNTLMAYLSTQALSTSSTIRYQSVNDYYAVQHAITISNYAYLMLSSDNAFSVFSFLHSACAVPAASLYFLRDQNILDLFFSQPFRSCKLSVLRIRQRRSLIEAETRWKWMEPSSVTKDAPHYTERRYTVGAPENMCNICSASIYYSISQVKPGIGNDDNVNERKIK